MSKINLVHVKNKKSEFFHNLYLKINNLVLKV
jgi:hypothetical protein